MDWKFVFWNDHWRLEISDMEQLAEYYEKTDYRWGNAFNNYLRIVTGQNGHYTNNLAAHIDQLARMKTATFIDTAMRLKLRVFSEQCDFIKKNGSIIINNMGGYWSEKSPEYTAVKYRKELIFPDFGEKDIRIKQWGNDNSEGKEGLHYYAYIGDLQVIDGDTLKWDTYAEAYNQAKKFITKQ